MLDDKVAIPFFPHSKTLHQKRFFLSSAEVAALTKQELLLVRTMVELYLSGAIVGIEPYSGGCNIRNQRSDEVPNTRLKQVGKRTSYTSERFEFSMYGASSDSDRFIDRHGIDKRDGRHDGLQDIGNYISRIAAEIPKSNALYESGKPSKSHYSNAGQFGFTLYGKAAKAMHKINAAMNPRVRGAGD